MTDHSAAQVREYVEHLENDSGLRKMRDEAKKRHELHSMNLPANLPDHMVRGVGVSIASPKLIWLANNILAATTPYPTTVTVTPFGTTNAVQEQADKLEKWATLFRVRLDDGRRVTREMRWHQLMSPYAVLMLRCGSPDEEFPWAMETPDPLTCFFPVEGGPMRPRVFARRFKQTVRDIQKTYSGRRIWDSTTGAWDGSNGLLLWDQGHWKFERMGADRQVEDANGGSSGGPFEEVECMELHDGEDIYIVASQRDSKDGEIVWRGRSMTGGVSAVIVPGNVSPLREPSERLQPLLWPAIQMVYLLNRIRSIRASRSEAMKPDMLISESPEGLAQQQATGDLGMAMQASLEAGGPSFINVRGKPVPWELQEDHDLDLQEVSLQRELDIYVQSMTEMSDPEVVKDSTANSFLTNLESRRKQQSPMLSNGDFAWNEVIKWGIHSIGEYDRDFELYSYGDGDHPGLKRGQGIKINKADLDFRYWLSVETKSTTEAEARARVQDWAYRKALGLSTVREGVTAAGYVDESQQFEKLAIDLGIRGSTPWVQQLVTNANIERIRLRARILIPGGAPAPSPTASAPAESEPPGGGFAPMQPAAVGGPTGGSAAGGPL